MTEHAIYTKVDAIPVHLGTPVWPASASASVTFARDRARIAPSFNRSHNWAFRSIRQLSEQRARPEADVLYLGSAQRIHLKRPEPAGVQNGLDRIGTAMTNPRLVRGTAGLTDRKPRVTAFDIYTGHFGLTARPFTLVPDPDFLFWSTAHQHAFAMLEYGVLTRAPITVITGEIGAGKTTLVQQLLRTIGEGARVGLISNTYGAPHEMLRWVMLSLGQPAPTDATYPGLVAAFQEYLIAEYARGQRVVLIFDEAQNLSREALEELRMLTNINSGKDELLQLVLVGQPELRETVRRADLHQFAQRVVATFHLEAMDKATVRAYIAHRLRVAGVKTNVFSEAATDLIHEATAGIPRRINQLCDLAMVYAYTADQQSVIRFTVQQVLDDGAFFGGSAAARTPALTLQ